MADGLDLDRYLPPPAELKEQGPGSGKSPLGPTAGTERSAARPSVATESGSRGASLHPSKVPPAEKPERTSSPTGAVASLDLDGRVRVGEMKLARLRFGSADLRIRAKDGRVDMDTLSEHFYQGRVAGRAGLDQSGNDPKVTFSQRAEGIETGSMLKDLIGDDRITGRGEISADLAASGRDVHALRQSLSGTAALHVGPGVVKGFNAERLIKEAGARLEGKPAPVGSPNRTEFNDLRANAEIRDGVLTSRDVAVSSDFLRVTGKGSADLVRERLDFRFKPVLVKSPPGQEIDELIGIPIPVRLTGTFAHPKWKVDVASALRAVAKRELQKENSGLFKKLEERTGIKGLEQGIRGLFGH
jgi:AsmA protein